MTYSTEQAEDAKSNAYAKAHFYTRDNMKHTPGPWKVDLYLTPNEDSDPIGVYTLRNLGKLDQEFNSLFPDTDEDAKRLEEIHSENQANANLIAAAPELLAALDDLVQAHVVKMGPTAVNLRVELAQTALAKTKVTP